VLRVPTIPALLPALVAINVFGHIALSGGRVATSLYALHSGASEFRVGVLIALYGVLPMLLSLPVGRWVDRIGPFAPMRAGVACVVAGVALPVLVPHVAALFFTAPLCGLGFTVVAVCAQHTIGNLHRDPAANRLAYFGWLALGHSTSGILGPIIVGIAIDAVGHRTAFAVLTASAGVALWLVTRHQAELRALHIDPAHKIQQDITTLVSAPAMRRIYAVGTLLAMSWDLFTFLMPILGHRRGLSASTTGAILSAFAAGTFSVRLVMARLARRFTEWQMLRAAIVVIVVVYLVLPFATVVPLFFLLGFALGTAVGCGQPNILSLLHTASPPGRGAEAVGLRAMLGNTSAVAVPLLFGATAATVGLTPVFWAVAVLVASAFPAAHRESRS
jgi:MFS family permease